MERYLAHAVQRAMRGQYRLRMPDPQPPPDGADWSHYHPNPELFFQVSGVNHFRFQEGALDLSEGEWAVIPVLAAHQEDWEEVRGLYAHVCMVMSLESVSCHLARTSRAGRSRREIVAAVRRPLLHGDLLRSLLAELVARWQSGRETDDAVVRGLQLAILGYLHEGFQRCPAVGNLHPTVAACRRRVEAVLTDPQLGTQDLASAVGCHPDHLSRLYHRETGERLRDYIVGQRILLARELLATTRRPVSEVARLAGFTDHAYFSACFRRRVGVSPRVYRAAVRRSGREQAAKNESMASRQAG
jgi:AraC-like DNA-binding protein